VQGTVTALPALVVETARGTFEVEMFPREAPVTVRHVLALVKAGFYDGQRVHRAMPGFVVQFGDPQTRNESLRHLWGRGPSAGSGTPVGVAEISASRRHRRGTVSLAHMGVPARAESQMFIALDDRPDLDGRYAIFGTVSVNPEVPGQLQVGDLIVRISARD
jgi:cyclophilin family peptidyl-prolyl cis-trans isomerase